MNAWLLKNVNPELLEIQTSMKSISAVSGPSVKEFSPFSNEPSNLLEVLKEVQRTEQCVSQIAKVHDSSFKPRDHLETINTLPEMDKVSLNSHMQ